MRFKGDIAIIGGLLIVIFNMAIIWKFERLIHYRFTYDKKLENHIRTLEQQVERLEWPKLIPGQQWPLNLPVSGVSATNRIMP